MLFRPLHSVHLLIQSRRMMSHFKTKIGPVVNFTMTMWKAMGEGICGLTCEDIMTFPNTSMFRSIVNQVGKQKDRCLGDAQVSLTCWLQG